MIQSLIFLSQVISNQKTKVKKIYSKSKIITTHRIFSICLLAWYSLDFYLMTSKNGNEYNNKKCWETSLDVITVKRFVFDFLLNSKLFWIALTDHQHTECWTAHQVLQLSTSYSSFKVWSIFFFPQQGVLHLFMIINFSVYAWKVIWLW